MAKGKHISVRKATYDRLKAYADAHNLSIASVVEKALAPALGHEPPSTRPKRRYRGPR